MFNSLNPYSQQKKSIIDLLNSIILNNDAKATIYEYIEVNEYGLAFDQITYELSENELQISKEVYMKIKDLADLMELPKDSYDFLAKLILD
jgi:hypothetical protein